MRIKYPRTPHLVWSKGITSDDVRCANTEHFKNKQVVVTEKMDGENTTLYADYMHARSLDSRYHPSRSWVKALQAQIGLKIPKGWRICGENLYAKHAIHYQKLPSYFLAFSVWNASNECLSWDDSQAIFNELGLHNPKVLYRGAWCEKTIKSIVVDTNLQEGYVVRVADAFHYDEFANCVAKWVRSDHIVSDKHWMHSVITPNKLMEE
ncbi:MULTISPECIES: RNA ligase family protein [Pseudoalteromonas]|uniref:RNA ligase family protein n=1 Tax=Pseudoalteromonas TaxID=53246 RepID=UPI001573F18F|nr:MULTISPECIES: RNA ligase family protein [Pseudoalteromonas]MBR8845570.1 RNA ligase family protein [Pseudoalteromonas sp. JC3]MCG9759102.1 RNA ligase family protein [Pseudoalteromonas sp. Isolate6]NSY34855.1 2'-5' RNA ligase [Pseudoalteromonas sp. JC28]QUI72571.1 2'-5' RNA ligase [Pseudoalteromonas sp. M8]UDM60093.1 RNA ligase family protein [Pseudoalteromonas piscicida]